MRICFAVAVLLATAAPSFCQKVQFFVARSAPNATPTFDAVEILTINKKDTVRVLPPGQTTVDPKTYGKLPKLKLVQLGTVKRDGKLLVQLTSDGKRNPLVPDQLKLKGAQKLEELWTGVSFVAQKSKSDKQPIAINADDFYALGSGASGLAAATQFVLARANFDSLGEQLNAITGLVEPRKQAPETDPARLFLERETSTGLQDFEGGGSYERFLDTIKYAETAQLLYPDVLKLNQNGRAIRQRKQLIDSSLAQLQSLYNNRSWDDFLDKYTPFEKYQASFPRMVENRKRAFLESARLHVSRGKALAEQKNYPEALKEMKLAVRRDPDNKALQDLVEETRIHAAKTTAEQWQKFRKELPKDSPQEVRFLRHINFASRFIGDKNFTEAEREIASATELDRDSPALLLVKARLLNGRNELAQALATLNTYDERTTSSDDRRKGEELRVDIMYNLGKAKVVNKEQLTKLAAEGQYTRGLALATSSLELDPDDTDFLYYSGVFSAVLRKNAPAVQQLQQYLLLSNAVNADAQRRDQAYQIISLLQQPRATGSAGGTNWASGRKLNADLFYCPESLTFQPHISTLQVGKQSQIFEWTKDGRLQAIVSKFEDGDKGMVEYNKRLALLAAQGGTAAQKGSFYFDYFPESFQVARVSLEPQGGLSNWAVSAVKNAEGSAEIIVGGVPPGNGSRYISLLNHPLVNPDVIELLDGRGAGTVGFAGNPYFNPFVWTGLHAFRFTYDKVGRVETASEIGANRVTRFQWDGDKLTALTVFATENKAERPVYRRSMSYAGDKLISETVDYSGKQSKIAYKWAGNRLLEAEFEDNGAHDGAERKVRF